ncbi:MAG: alpha/beta hydrolase family protein [Candidatus Ornithospirochaeta sp.]
MKKIKLEDFLEYTYLSSIKMSEDGTFFVAAKANKDRTGYDRDYWMLLSDGPRQLTHDGKAGGFQTRGGKLYFPAKRTEEEKKDKENTFIYALPISGGEAYRAFTVDGTIGKFDFLSDDTLVALKRVDKRTEDLKKEEKEKISKELNGYEDIEEMGFYMNGEGYVNGRRSRLVIVKDGKCRRVFDDDFNTESFSLNEDKTKILAVGINRRGPKEEFFSEIREVNVSDGKWSTILPVGSISVYGAEYVEDKIIAIGSDMSHHGLNQNPDFYTIEDGKAKLLKTWGEAIGNSVGTDIRLGGGSPMVKDGSWLYFTTTLDHSSYIYRINKEGEIESIVGDEGSVDSFAVFNGEVKFIGLRDQKLQEIYSADEECLTHFNDKILEGKYVAECEEIEYENDGIRLTGWVIKPFGYEKGKKYPAIFDIHGGPKTVYGTVFMHEMQYWANEGYFVFWTNPRGADGRGDDFADIRGKYGTIDYSDLMKFTDVVLERYPDIDKERLGETGGSYGGFMSNWILGHTDRFKAIATQRSIYNWVSFWGTSDIGPYFAEDQCRAGIHDLEGLFHRSPMEEILKNAKTPTLIIHSDKDYRCPVSEGYQLYSALVDMGVESKLMLFHDETHELSRSGKPCNRVKRLKEITLWMDKHLKSGR